MALRGEQRRSNLMNVLQNMRLLHWVRNDVSFRNYGISSIGATNIYNDPPQPILTPKSLIKLLLKQGQSQQHTHWM